MPRLIHGRDFGAVNLVTAIFGGLGIGTMSLVPLYAVNRYHMDVFDSGTLLIAQGLATITFSITATMVLRRTGYRRPIYLGGCIVAMGMLALGLSPRLGLTPYQWLASAAFLVGIGSGILNPASRNAGLQLAPQHSSTLAALRSVCMQLGAIVAISGTTAILTAAADPGKAQAAVLAVTAAFLVASLPLVRRVPEHHGSW